MVSGSNVTAVCRRDATAGLEDGSFKIPTPLWRNSPWFVCDAILDGLWRGMNVQRAIEAAPLRVDSLLDQSRGMKTLSMERIAAQLSA
jgi:hypothetical protein